MPLIVAAVVVVARVVLGARRRFGGGEQHVEYGAPQEPRDVEVLVD